MSTTKRHPSQQPKRNTTGKTNTKSNTINFKTRMTPDPITEISEHVLHGEASSEVRKRLSEAMGLREGPREGSEGSGQRPHLHFHKGGMSGCLPQRGNHEPITLNQGEPSYHYFPTGIYRCVSCMSII